MLHTLKMRNRKFNTTSYVIFFNESDRGVAYYLKDKFFK